MFTPPILYFYCFTIKSIKGFHTAASAAACFAAADKPFVFNYTTKIL
ncbi:hypothetical protein ANACOL_04421 [Anaerotruncus colihominis DSM 17241]|uniref:Uncharacterized protein n=1 Tax=Anaerotruncus colihominis DSM 17241 TaxID=445972 RepID=B0PHX8_9FIRM|nr:hypothetical protein ANACOL_04421 [Anaerotruncus colihominis DSM 17241]